MPWMFIFLTLVLRGQSHLRTLDLSVLLVLWLYVGARRRRLATDLVSLLTGLSLWFLAPLYEQWHYWYAPQWPPVLSEASAGLALFLSQRLTAAIPASELLDFQQAVLLGNRAALAGEVKEAFRGLGISHMLAVSGFHVGLWITVFTPLIRLGRAAWARWLIWAVLVAFLALYAGAVGGSASVVRAVATFAAAHLGQLRHAQAHPLHWPALVGVGAWLWDPGVVRDLGFLLSYTAVVAILLALGKGAAAQYFSHWSVEALGKVHWVEKLLLPIQISLAAWAATLPLVQETFGGASPYFLLGNLFAVPVYTAFIWVGFALLALGSWAPESVAALAVQAFGFFQGWVVHFSTVLPGPP